MGEDIKKYNKMENVLQRINLKYISLSDAEVKTNNEILKQVVSNIIEKMKTQSVLFKGLYDKLFYGGSYYDGLRVGHPEEFDLDLLLRLPKLVDVNLTISNMPGFVNVQLKNVDAFQKQPVATEKYHGFNELLDDKYFLDTSKVKRWMEGIVIKALNQFPKHGGQYVITVPIGTFYGTYSKSGPAMTLMINGAVNRKPVKMDIDLVPCFVFDKNQWPTGGYRDNPVATKSTFFVVPKEPKNAPGIKDRYWRLSFQEQERELIKGYNRLKPALKLLKQLRENLGHVGIASYYIKTMFLWEVDERRGNPKFWNEMSLSYIFMHMLKKYIEYIEKKNVSYYWNKRNNLIGAINDSTQQNILNRLKRIVQDVERNLDDPYVIAKYLLNGPDLITLKMELSM